MAKAPKKAKEKTFQYYGLNIKLQSDERKGEDVYYSLLKSIFDQDLHEKIGAERAMTFKTQFTSNFLFKERRHKVLHGQLVRYTILDEDHWYNTKTKEFEKYDTPDDIFPNGFETHYIFIPAAHRFYFAVNQKVSIVSVETFITKALKKIIGVREEIRVNLIQSNDTFDEIIFAKQLKSLRVSVSYTNDDIGKEAMELMDNFLKDAQIGEAEAVFKPDQHGNLNTDSAMVRGFLEVAKENGEAEATIVKEDGKQKKIVTKNYPEKRPVIVTDTDDVNNKLFNDVMKEYRDEQ